MNDIFFNLFLSSITLPALALLALLLRRELVTGKIKIILLGIGLVLLGFAVVDSFHSHGEDLELLDFVIGAITAFVTFGILALVNHKHTHNKEEAGAKGIVLSEAFHSLIDGAVIGATYLVSPLLGYAATLGIVIHELPKIVGTLVLFRGLGLSVKKTILYGALAQGGSPVAAVCIYLLGKRITHEEFHLLEIMSLSSLVAIILWIIFLEVRHHRRHVHVHE